MIHVELETQKLKDFLIKFIPKMVDKVDFVDLDWDYINLYGGYIIKVKYLGDYRMDEGESFRVYYDILKVISFYDSTLSSFSVNFVE